jgi:hypothetical protein
MIIYNGRIAIAFWQLSAATKTPLFTPVSCNAPLLANINSSYNLQEANKKT